MFREIKRLREQSAGNVAVLVALAIIPLLAAGGLAIDYTRALQFKTTLQGAVDSAALAGASELSTSTTTAKTMATTYLTAEITKLPPNNGVTYTVTVPNSSSVVVSATGQMKNHSHVIVHLILSGDHRSDGRPGRGARRQHHA